MDNKRGFHLIFFHYFKGRLNPFLIRFKYLHITSKGKQLLDLVPSDLRSPMLTAEWEEKLAQIAKGKLKKDTFIQEIKGYTKEIVREIKNKDVKFKHDNMTGTKCPECGKLMLEVKTRNGRMLVCQDRSCKGKKNIAKKTNARCPNCHKRMEMRGEGTERHFPVFVVIEKNYLLLRKEEQNSRKTMLPSAM